MYFKINNKAAIFRNLFISMSVSVLFYKIIDTAKDSYSNQQSKEYRELMC